MRNGFRRMAGSLLAGLLIPFSAWGEETNFYERYRDNGSFPTLQEVFQESLQIGAAMKPEETENADTTELFLQQYSFLASGDAMNPDNILNVAYTKRAKDPGRARISPAKARTILNFAQEHHVPVSAGILAGNALTPRWFFTREWVKSERAELADRETMTARLENYIHDVLNWTEEEYPGTVDSWTVVSLEESGLWEETIGADWAELAFSFARKYAAPGQKLFCRIAVSDAEDAYEEMKSILLCLWEDGLMDGVVLNGSWTVEEPPDRVLEEIMADAAERGWSLRVENLEILGTGADAFSQMELAVRYKKLMRLFRRFAGKSVNVPEAISFSGVTDQSVVNVRAKKDSHPLLFDRNGLPKPAFFGTLLDDVIPESNDREEWRAAADRMGLKASEAQEEMLKMYKKLTDHNPVMVQKFGADPWAMVYGDRVYLYMTGDEPMFDEEGKIRNNTYGNIRSLRVLSSADMVNWQDHGEIRAAGRDGAARWANNSWAPCAAWKNIDGKDKFFLYFADNGSGIGVLTADSPTGPFTDPIGKQLVSRNTPTCAGVTWLFDPAVLVDEDGEAYLYFGGGIPEGKAENPGTARVVKLGKDMISLDGDPTALNPPWLFEDSGINRFGDTYVYSYCSNFQVPGSGSKQGFYSGEIVTMTADQPMGPFTPAGRVLKNPGSYFGTGGNNHHCMFQFRGKWYIAYHAATIDRDKGWNAGYRSTFIDELKLDAQGLPALSEGTLQGVEQLMPLSALQETEAETLVNLCGVQVSRADGASAGMAVESQTDGSWIAVSGADFGPEGAARLCLRFRSEEGGRILVKCDKPEGMPEAILTLPPAGEWRTETFEMGKTIQGLHDLYFCFDAPGIQLDTWQFMP